MPTVVNKYELYQQVLKLEFIREFHALVEAANGRGEFKADFTDKILALVGKMVEPVVDAGNVVLPGVPALVKKSAESIINKGKDTRNKEKSHYFLQQGFEYNPNTLTVLAEQVSLAALKRYQWFISQLEQDSVILFAKAGVERMLEYLARKQLHLSLQHLLDGLLQGHSGAYMSGYFNTQLTPIDCLAERIPLSNKITSKIKGAMGFTRVTAEGIYGRSGLLTCDDNSLELHTHAQLDKNKAKHKIDVDQQEQSRFERVKEALSKEGRERWFDYGYTKAHFEHKEEPKYGYALVSPAEVIHYYGDEKTITTMPLADLKSPLKDSLTRFAYEILPFNKTQLKNYLVARKKQPRLTLLAYLKEQFNSQEARLAYFDADDKDLSDVNLSGAHLDDCVFDQTIFPADLSNTTLRNSFLRHADFKLVQKAQGLDLSGAHAEYVDAEGANLAGAILRSANLLGANLAKANLTDADILGTNLLESNTQEAISPNFNLQDIQAKQEELAAQQQRIEEKQNAQSEEIAALRKTVGELHANNQINIAEKLDQFLQERAAREALERYCHSEIEKLNIQAQQQERLGQQQAEHLQSLEQDLIDLHKLQVASQNESKNLLNQFKQLSTRVDRHGSQLKEIEQLLDKIIGGMQNQLNQHEQRLGNLHDEVQVIKRNLEKKKPEPSTSLPVKRLQQIKQGLCASYQKRAVMFEFAPKQVTPISLPITEKTFIHLALVAQAQQQKKELEIRNELKQNGNDVEEKGVDKKATKESQEKTDHKSEDLQRQQLLNSWEMLSQVQEPISVNELWLEHKSDRSIPQHLLIEGSAGIGKTTLCGFIAVQWSQQKLWTERFDWVLWIPLRNLIDTSRYPRLAYDYLVKSFILGECFGCLPNDRKPGLTLNEQDRLWQQLEEQADRVLYILDGYDEIAGYEKRPELAHLKAAFSQLLQSQHVLLTTRPQVINAELLKEQQTRRLVTLGLSDENIPLYVDNYFKAISRHSEQKLFSLVEEKNPQVVNLKGLKADQPTENVLPYIENNFNTTRSHDPKEKTITIIEDKNPNIPYLLESLKANQTLWSVSHVPLHLSLICLAYAEGMIKAADLKQSLSLTQLYQKIVKILLHRYFLKENSKGATDIEAKRVEVEDVELEPNTQRVAQFLEVFAFQGMGQYDLILDKKLLNESLKATNQTFAIIPSLIASGLLKEVNDQGKAAYQFVHLTFQEFFAARFLARRFQQQQISINDWIERFHEYKHIPRFAVMLWFTAGLLKDEPSHLQQYMQLLQAPPRDEVGLYHLGLVMRCIAEAGYPKELNAQISQHLGQLVEKSWFVIREAAFSKDGNKEIRAQSAQQVLQWLEQQRVLTPKIEFSAVSLKAIVNDLSYKSLVFKDEDWCVKKAAAEILGILKAPTPEILEGLVALLKDNNRDVRQAAAKALALALGELKAPTPEILQGLVALLKDNDCDVRQAAARALGELKAPTPEILQGLVASLKDNDSDVRQAAARALGELKAPTSEILLALVDLLKDNDRGVRQVTARALDELKAPTPEILLALFALLKDEKWQAREGAARALGELKAPTPEILQGLVALLKDNDRYVREAAAWALGKLKAPTPEILQGLVALLKDNEGNVRHAAALALGELKAPTPEILQGLVALLKDKNQFLRQAAALALGELKSPTPEILQGLVALLKDDAFFFGSNVRQAAARALGELKAPTPEILQGLGALLKDEDYRVRETAAEGLARSLVELKEPTSEILQNVEALLKDEDYRVRETAAEGLARSLGELKAPNPKILQALVAMLKDKKWQAREGAARVLGELKVPNPEILQGLVALLKDDLPWVMHVAAKAFNNFSTASLLTLYFQQSCKLYQSNIQERLFNFIVQRWLVNRQVVKFVNKEIYWLEQGQWQHLSIPDHHPHFQSYLTKFIKERVGVLSLTFPKLTPSENVAFFSPRSSLPQTSSLVEHKDPWPKQ